MYITDTFSPAKKKEVSPHRFGRKRFDRSPVNQNRLSPNFIIKDDS